MTTILYGLDYRDQSGALVHIKPADIESFQGGKSFVIEYIGVAQGQGNAALTASDAAALESQGLSIVSVYENRPLGQPGMSGTDPQGNYTSGWVDYLSHPGQGTTDAQNAIIGAASAGQLSGAIYFAMDFDPAKSTDPITHTNRISEGAALNLIDKYFQDISVYFNNYNQMHGTSYQIGIYGAGDALAKVVNDPLVMADGNHAYTWLAGATAWAGSDTFSAWDLKQYDNDQFKLDGRNVDLDQSSGQDFGQWGRSSTQTIEHDYAAITRDVLSSDQAGTIANSINAGTQTEAQYVTGLLSEVAHTTIPAVAVEASMYGAVGTSVEVTKLVNEFLPAQVNFAIAHGFDPVIFVSEALGLVFAFGNEQGSTSFVNQLGPSNATMPNSTTGDAAFATAASAAIFGSASTTNLINVMEGYVANWKAFYGSNGLPGTTNPSADQIDLAARGAAWGDAVGFALADNFGPLKAQAANFLMDAAEGIANYSMSLVGQPAHHPFQGEV
jgi:hypothetical protein